jgi:hypothetical protein
MIYFFTPYSFNLKLLDAIARCMDLLQPDDWAVIMDGDAMFLQPDFGHRIKRHIEPHPEAGLFTCYASRCHYSIQVPPGVDMDNDTIRYYKLVANHLAETCAGKVTEIKRRIAGHLMVIKIRTGVRSYMWYPAGGSRNCLRKPDTMDFGEFIEQIFDLNFVS